MTAQRHRYRYRIRFRKDGDLRWIGHRDLLRLWERLLRRADVRLSMSEGFHPKVKMTFPSALALGIEGLDEVMEIELDQELEPVELAARLTAHAPPGFHVENVRRLEPHQSKAQVRSVTYEIAVPPEQQAAASQAVEQFLSQSCYLASRGDGRPSIDVRAGVECLQIENGTLKFRLRTNRAASVRPREILSALGLADLENEGLCLRRTAVELSS